MGKKNDYLTVEDSAHSLGKPISWMKDIVSRGEIGAKLSGGRWLIALRELDKLRANLPSEPGKAVHDLLAGIPLKESQHLQQNEPVPKVGKSPAKREGPAKDKSKELKLRYRIKDLDKTIRDLDLQIKAEYARHREAAKSGDHLSKTVLNTLLFKKRLRNKKRQEAHSALAKEQAQKEQTSNLEANHPKKTETKQPKEKRVSGVGELERGQLLYRQITALQRQIKTEAGKYEEAKQKGKAFDVSNIKLLLAEHEALKGEYAELRKLLVGRLLGPLPELILLSKQAPQQKSKPPKRPSGQSLYLATVQKVPQPPAVPTRYLSWRILPPGELSVDSISRHYDKLQRQDPGIKYEKDRIIKAFSLNPKECYVGKNQFEGYVVFTFFHTPKALLECPLYGNAIYIIDSDWKRWSRMSKQELLRSHEVIRVIHRGDWFSEVKRKLKSR